MCILVSYQFSCSFNVCGTDCTKINPQKRVTKYIPYHSLCSCMMRGLWLIAFCSGHNDQHGSSSSRFELHFWRNRVYGQVVQVVVE